MIWNAFLLAIRQIWRNPLRSLLTVLGVVIGVAAVITMVTIGNGASTAIKTEIESFGNNQLMLRPGMRLGPGQKVGAPNFRLDDVTALRTQLAGIEAVAPQVSKSMTVVANGRNWQTSVVGTNTDYFTIDNRTFEDGRNFEEAEERAGSAVCVIGSTVANELFGTTQNVVGRQIRTGGFSCRVIGLLKTKGTAAMGGDQDDLLVMPLKSVQRRILGDNRVSALLIRINADSDRERLKTAVKDLMRERRSLSSGDDDNFQIMDTAEIAAKVASTTQIMTTLLAAVAGVSLLVGGIGIMNIMLVSVTERTAEIGLKKAIGARKKRILLQFLTESAVLTSLGGIIGVISGVILAELISNMMQIPVSISAPAIIVAVVFSTFIGVVFGMLPAYKAANLNPIEALRRD